MYDIKKFDIATSVTDALLEVFDMMLSMQLELTDESGSHLLVDEERIVGSVSLAGKVMGTVNIHIGREFAGVMTAAMLGIDVEEVAGDEDVKDVISEICNMVGGGLKSNFCDAGLTCRLSTPSFTTGSRFKIESLNTSRHERYVFAHGEQQIVVEVGVRANDSAEDGADAVPDESAPLPDPAALERFDIGACLSEGLVEVFDTMLSLSLSPAPASDAELLEGERIVGSVNFIGVLMGSMNIFLKEPFSRKMTAAMLGIDVEEVAGDDEVKDVVSEICNMVGGSLKSKFNDAGMQCQLSTPSFTAGSDFIIESQHMERYERFAFQCRSEMMFVEVGLKLTKNEGVDAARPALTPPEDPSGVLEEISADDPTATARQTGETAAASGQALATGGQHRPQAGADASGDAVPNDALAAVKASVDAPQRAIDALIRAEKKAVQERTAAPADPSADEENDAAEEELVRQAAQRRRNLGFIMEIPVELTVELGRTRQSLRDVLRVDEGAVIEFSNLAGEPVEILVNDTLIAKGEIVVEREKYGVQVTETISRMERIKSLGL